MVEGAFRHSLIRRPIIESTKLRNLKLVFLHTLAHFISFFSPVIQYENAFFFLLF